MAKVCSQKGEMERAENARTDQEMEIQSEKRTEVCERRSREMEIQKTERTED